MGYAGHALNHLVFCQHLVKFVVGILETMVAVKQRVSVRILLYCLLERVEYLGIVVAVANDIRNNTAVV